MPILQEELLEPIARYLRFREVVKYIDQKNNVHIADIGSGPNTPMKTYLRNNGIKISSYVAIDPLLNKRQKKVDIIKRPVIKRIPIKQKLKDYVIAAAFLEHIDNPKEILHEMIRITKPGGKIIITTPSPRAKTILEFLSDRLNLISRREIQEHKNYFDRGSLLKLLPKNKKSLKIYHKYFEFGLNNLLVIEKKP